MNQINYINKISSKKNTSKSYAVYLQKLEILFFYLLKSINTKLFKIKSPKIAYLLKKNLFNFTNTKQILLFFSKNYKITTKALSVESNIGLKVKSKKNVISQNYLSMTNVAEKKLLSKLKKLNMGVNLEMQVKVNSLFQKSKLNNQFWDIEKKKLYKKQQKEINFLKQNKKLKLKKKICKIVLDLKEERLYSLSFLNFLINKKQKIGYPLFKYIFNLLQENKQSNSIKFPKKALIQN